MARVPVTAVLGPTNTGKTHLAVERLCAHSSGMMGFPLRLLAREIYDRVKVLKGERSVALITGEERIAPPDARWLICTTESMPVTRDVAFVALDEAQLGADRERGHVFTDRLLHVRGREETMILGSDTLRPLVRSLCPEAEIISRPRFSDLSYAGTKKLSRLPPRSAIVAFSAEEVYAIAEMIRRTRGGAAVVMGALSPRTRNAQIELFQSGEVDFLVATDAIGMGLNMDVGHIAFAGLSKFDGQRQRRLTVSEMAQIAGRAGRHQRDGTFGTVAGSSEANGFTEIEIERIEEHRFPPLDHLFWRNTELDYEGIEELITSLERLPDRPGLRVAPEATDLAVLKRLASDPQVITTAGSARQIGRLWEVCGLPDFRQTGPEFHARLVTRLFHWLRQPEDRIPDKILADELTRLDSIQGDISTITARIASARTWAYATQRPDWVGEPERWADRTRALEEKLSDALHNKLTQRFVDRRTTMLARSMGGSIETLAVTFPDDGSVRVDDESIGTLLGFEFRVDPTARLGERKKLLAAAERCLRDELALRAAALTQSPDRDFMLDTQLGQPVSICWRGQQVAGLAKGNTPITPRIVLKRAMAALREDQRTLIAQRLDDWIAGLCRHRLAPLERLFILSRDAGTSPELRAVVAELVAGGGRVTRADIDAIVRVIPHDDKRHLRQLGIVVGTLDLFHPTLLKPEPVRLWIALRAAAAGEKMLPLPMPGLTLLDRPSLELAASARVAGYRAFGNQMVRIDLVERIARALHDQRKGAPNFAPDTQMATAIGIGEATLLQIMRALGFRQVGEALAGTWRWQGAMRGRPATQRPNNPSFAALGAWRRGGDRS
jgi:ATP-dependent RNA helicase SUPV3L1/SUV3